MERCQECTAIIEPSAKGCGECEQRRIQRHYEKLIELAKNYGISTEHIMQNYMDNTWPCSKCNSIAFMRRGMKICHKCKFEMAAADSEKAGETFANVLKSIGEAAAGVAEKINGCSIDWAFIDDAGKHRLPRKEKKAWKKQLGQAFSINEVIYLKSEGVRLV